MEASWIREEISKAKDARIEPVPTPEWPSVNGHVFVRTMSAFVKDRFVSSLSDIKAQATPDGGVTANITVFTQQASLKLVSMTACDENGNLIFTEGDVAMLGERDAVCMQRLVDKTSEINGLSDKAKGDAKNSSASVTVEVRPSGSNTDSLAT